MQQPLLQNSSIFLHFAGPTQNTFLIVTLPQILLQEEKSMFVENDILDY